MTRSRRIVLAALAIAALAFAGVAVAYAAGLAFTGDDGVIHACVNVENGNLRVLDQQSEVPGLGRCRANETAITWNQVGPAGPAGQVGSAGADGAAGPAGPAGANGVSGYEVVTAASNIYQAHVGTITATCPAGKVPMGGGLDAPYYAYPFGSVLNATILASYPNGSGWTTTVYQGLGGTVTVYAVCVNAT